MGAATPTNHKLFGWKHGDVGSKTYLHYSGKLLDAEMMPLDWAASRDMILFVIYRNPMSWLRSLHRNPHQSPGSLWLTFEEFVRKPFGSFHCNPPGSDSLYNRSSYDPIEYKNLQHVLSSITWEEANEMYRPEFMWVWCAPASHPRGEHVDKMRV
jgi:hypothetical protein